MNWLRYDTMLSPDNRSMNLKTTCMDDVKKMLIMWPASTEVTFVKGTPLKSGRRSIRAWLFSGT